jgi:hypothetical protein
MGATKKPRKAYKPRAIDPRAHLLAIRGAAFVDRPEIESRRSILGASVDAACQGRAVVADWKRIFDAINTLDMLVRMRIAKGSGVAPAMDVMDAVMSRAKAGGSTALRFEERQVLRDVFGAYMECIEQITCAQLYTAETTVGRVIRGALQEGRHSDAVVVDAEQMEGA